MERPSDRQAEAAEHRGSALRIRGPARSGKTSSLRIRAEGLASDPRRGAVLHLATAAAAGTTFFDLAAGILERHGRPRRILTTQEQEDVVAALLASEGPGQWPTLHPALAEPEFAPEVAGAVCAYQASFLGVEELRTHSHAAGTGALWEELAAFTDRYLDALRAAGDCDWAGALVEASLLLRRPDVRSAETDGLVAVLVDDWETGTFATNRLLTQLAGPAGDIEVTVAGNPATAVAGSTGASPAYLDRFVRRFAGARAIDLDAIGRSRPAATVVEGDGLGLALAAEHDRDAPWEDMVVIVRDRAELAPAVAALETAGIPAFAESATTRWEASGPRTPEAVGVVTLEVTPSRS
ncbi:MAG: hypothetical protein QOG03_1381, partial [Actinomycetota bacterium]|nr:hypothetical protein [Actinomycetota bacterium]